MRREAGVSRLGSDPSRNPGSQHACAHALMLPMVMTWHLGKQRVRTSAPSPGPQVPHLMGPVVKWGHTVAQGPHGLVLWWVPLPRVGEHLLFPISSRTEMRRFFFTEMFWEVIAEISPLSLPSVYFYHLITQLVLSAPPDTAARQPDRLQTALSKGH